MATLILKPTEACNAACVYCEVDRKGWHIDKIMPFEVLELLFVRINEFLHDRTNECMEVVWHGGEPLLLGERYFAKALEFQQKHCPLTADRIRHRIQTNLTLFSPRFTDIFRQLGITNVGTSYDPVDGVRVLKKGRTAADYNRRFLNGVGLLEKEGFGWGVICVVTRLSLERPLDIFYFMTNLAADGGVMFNPVTVDKPSQKYLEITDEEFAGFLGAIFPVWWKHRDQYPRVEPFSWLTKALLSGTGRPLFCADTGNCANTHVGLGPNGRLSQCGRSADWAMLDHGTIFDRTFSQVFSDPQRAELLRRNEILLNGACGECPYWSVCHGGCPLDAWANAGSLMGKTGWCRSRRQFIEQYFVPVTGITPKLPRFEPNKGQPVH